MPKCDVVLGVLFSGAGLAFLGWIRMRYLRPALTLSVRHQVVEAPITALGGLGASSSLLSGPIPASGNTTALFFRVAVGNVGGSSADSVLIYLTRIQPEKGTSWTGEQPLLWKDWKDTTPRIVAVAQPPIEADFGSVAATFPNPFRVEAKNADNALPRLGPGTHTFTFTAKGTGRMTFPEMTLSIHHRGYWPNGTEIIDASEKHAGRFFGYLLTNPRT